MRDLKRERPDPVLGSSLDLPQSLVRRTEDNLTPPASQTDLADRVIFELCRRFPQAFDRDPWARCPLRVGIRKDLDRALAGAIPREALTAGLADYVSSTGYLAGLVEGEPRIDLSGNDVDLVTEGQASVARDILVSRRRRGLLVECEDVRP